MTIVWMAVLLAVAPLTWEDTLKFAGVVEVLSPVEVQAPAWGWSHSLPPVREVLTRALEATGVDLIRRGPSFASDLFVDGFRRSDLPIVVDGQHVYNACPNRMDVPLVRINPLEVHSTEIVLQSADVDAGLGGVFRVVRRDPSRTFQPLGYLQLSGESERGLDLGAATEFLGHGVYLRHSRAQPYTDAQGRSFQDLYGYRPQAQTAYQITEASFRGKNGAFRYGLSLATYRDVLFPYLLMDERDNRGGDAFVEWNGHRLYLQTFRHLMDNRLRTSSDRMEMATDARILVAGIRRAGLYDLVIRRWRSDNEMIMQMNGMPMTLDQRMLDLLDIRWTTGGRYALSSGMFLQGRVGLERISREDGRLDPFLLLTSHVSRERWLPMGSLAFHRDLSYGRVMLEAALESLDPEVLYLALKRPPMNGMPQPYWLGNPDLSQPVKLALRYRVPYTRGSLHGVGEFFVHHVWNYTELDRVTAQGQPIQTYQNVDALMAGFRFQARWQFFQAEAHYTWAENRTERVPLSEVPPLHLRLEARPELPRGRWTFMPYLAFTYEASQERVNATVGESPTPSWYRVDAGLALRVGSLRLEIGVDNLTQQEITRHLSYLRSPFQQGVRVYDPGRRISVSIWSGS